MKPARELAEKRLNARIEKLVRAGKDAGDIATFPPQLSPHSGGRTAITWWAEAGEDPRQVMSWVGHSEAGLTLRLYTQARDRETDQRIIAAMATVPAEERHTPR